MGRPKKWRLLSAAHARASKKTKHEAKRTSTLIEVPEIDLTGVPSDTEETRWTGGVNHDPETENSDFSWEEESDSPESEEGVTDDEDPKLVERLQRSVEHRRHLLNMVTAYKVLMAEATAVDWKKAECKRALGYTGNSARTIRRRDKQAWDKEKENAVLRKL